MIDQRRRVPTTLTRLAAWKGGIQMIDNAQFRITEEMAERLIYKKLGGTTPIYGSLGWYEETVARDPERCLAWLSTMGYLPFAMNGHNLCGRPWEDWCTW